jgi:hypothetical protein
MIDLLLSSVLATTPAELEEITKEINEEVVPQETIEKPELERIFDRFRSNCDGFYGCGISYPGVNW